MIAKTFIVDSYHSDCLDEIDEHIHEWPNRHIEILLIATHILEIEFISVITGAIDDR